MKLLAEENLANNIVTAIEHSFTLQKNIHVTFISGNQLKEIPIGQKILDNSLNDLQENYHLKIGKNYNQIVPTRLYLTIFEPLANNQNSIKLVVPFSANIASILIGALIKNPKDKTWTETEITTNLDEIKRKSFDDLVIYQLFKFYTPDKEKVPTVPKEILKKISYKGFENDSFNMEILFELPINDIYQPLQLKIIEHEKNTDYNEISLAPVKFISYDEKSKKVQLITSLY
jgi:hypothetical protein